MPNVFDTNRPLDEVAKDLANLTPEERVHIRDLLIDEEMISKLQRCRALVMPAVDKIVRAEGKTKDDMTLYLQMFLMVSIEGLYSLEQNKESLESIVRGLLITVINNMNPKPS